MCCPHVALTGRPVLATVPRRPRGFSLLELLVALMVIVLVTSMVSLTFTSGGQDVQLETTVRNLRAIGFKSGTFGDGRIKI